MLYWSFISLICFLGIIFLFFEKKIMVLLSLEGLMMTLILIMTLTYFSSMTSFFILILLSVFMVLDSVFGISLMVCNSRCSSLGMKVMS